MQTVVLILQRRVSVVLHAVFFFVPVAVERQGQGQHLAVHRHTLAAGLRYDVQSILGGDVDEVHTRAGSFRQPDHAAKGQILHRLGVNQMDVVPVPVAALLGQQVVVHDQLIVLTVNRQNAVVPGDLLHDVLQPARVNLADGGQGVDPTFRRPNIGREYLDAGKPAGDQLAVAGDGVGSAVVLVDAVG